MNQDSPNSNSNAAPETGGVRFAPSPTGRFHVGNLRTAWISWTLAKARGLKWAVRYEDIDRPRVIPGAQQLQISDMRELGMAADVTLVQSEFYPRHLELFERARREGVVYACDCSRKDVQTALAGMASAPNDGLAPIYSGACRSRHYDPISGFTPPLSKDVASLAWRMKMPPSLEQEANLSGQRSKSPSSNSDGSQYSNAHEGQDDFIVARTSPSGDHFVPSYHWACAIDDIDGGYDLLVRSIDLASALPSQRAIQQWVLKAEGLSRALPKVFHTALVTQNDGHRLEKRTAGVTLEELHSRGVSTEKLIQIFEESFALDAQQIWQDLTGTSQASSNDLQSTVGADSRGVAQERQTSLTLAQLGL